MFTYFQLAGMFARIGWVDVAAFILILWGLVTGARKGLESELPKFLEVAITTVITLHHYPLLGSWLNAKLSAPTLPADLISFLAVAFLSFLTVRLLFNLLGTIVSLKFMSTISKVGGAMMGGVRFILGFSLVSYFFLLIPLTFFSNSYAPERSWSGPFFAQTSQKFYRFATYYMPFRLEFPVKTG